MENPLITYKIWFKGLSPCWAERIASFIFNTVKHYKPLNDTCFAAASIIHSFHRNSGGYADWLLELIRDHISGNDPYSNQQLAVLLHCGTQMVLEADKQSRYRNMEQYENVYIRALLTGDLRSAAYFEQKLRHPDHLEPPIHNSWNVISSSGFSFASIHSYLMRSVTRNYE